MDLKTLTELLEALTILCFGLSWPISIRKSYISRTAKGKSLFFEVFLLIGYAFGICRKVIQVTELNESGFLFFLGFVFYCVNFIAISIDIVLYFRNSKLDREAHERHIKKNEATAKALADAQKALEEASNNK